jgi:DivIVA domain-containing protein
MPLTPEEIKGRKFPINLRGYEKQEVDSFLRRVAADYGAAIAAIASAADPYGSLGREVSNVLRTAKESAEGLRRETEEAINELRAKATQEAESVQRQAAEAAAATLEQAREKAVALTNDAERRSREAKEQEEAVKRKASEEAMEIRRKAAEEAAATLDAATERAERLTAEAHRHARELREAAERQSKDILVDAARRQEKLQEHEHELHERVDAIDSALARLRAELRADNSVAEGASGDQPSPSVAARLREIEPDLDQVATALEGADSGGRVIRLDDAPTPQQPTHPTGNHPE